MTMTLTDTIEPTADLDIEDILDAGLPSRNVLLAALLLVERLTAMQDHGVLDGWLYDAAIEYNAHDTGWEFGMHGAGSEWPSHTGIRFTPEELYTVVRLARYLIAREQVETDGRTEAAS